MKIGHGSVGLDYLEAKARKGLSLLQGQDGKDLTPTQCLKEIRHVRADHPGFTAWPPCPEAWNTEDGHCPGHEKGER